MNIDKDNIVQVKLVTCQEILAVTVEQNDDSFICSHVLDMVPCEYEDDYVDDNKTFYILRPYVSYTDNMENIVSINPFTVVSICTPAEKVIEQYITSLETIQDLLGKGESASADVTAGNVVSFPSSKKLLTED